MYLPADYPRTGTAGQLNLPKVLTIELLKQKRYQSDFLPERPDCVWGHPGYARCSELKTSVSIIGVDGLPGPFGGIDLVSRGILKATLLYPTGGKEAIQTAANILEQKPYEKETSLASTVIDSTNVRIMKLQNEKVLAQEEEIDKGQKIIEDQVAPQEIRLRSFLPYPSPWPWP